MTEPRILVVDDEDVVRDNVQWVMHHQGWSVDTASSEAEARDRLQSANYDAVIADMKMDRDASGIEILKLAKELSPAVEVIILTAYGNLQNAARAMELGAYSYVEKNVPNVDVYQILLLKVKQALEKKRLEEENRCLQARLINVERQATLGVLSSAIAHDVHNPLTGVLGYADLVLESIDENSPIYRDVLMIQEGALRCKEILRHILDFARPDEGETMPVDVQSSVDRIMVLLQRAAMQKKVDIACDFTATSTIVMASPNQVSQVIMNLIVNACQAMPDGGRVRIHTSNRNGSVILRLSDTGKGIPQESIARVFDPFFSTKSRGEGTGLGLYICKDIVTQLDGTIEVESEVGKGTTFTIALPTV
ncbi:MAG: response regulator [Armatimonadetes bacterium]|nr:response regulator [Armatimonadota bacterium]PIU66626.1 MAG: hypothetical protein COS85_04045 [Armatimonadetes bacterium CG07_land_8_20_14_0_80_59_28]PIY48753.1 MAG: hypothetical protein COZ05_02255 [Armatimonadetes bacterium CG_4_10_14_3_um_filter_59_10]PJB64036.1 MAG: hypothetical protein CO095_15300 [Armatimonadetes bacterium CG_4_9_14_3_um_filter_58_7]